jgi:hypothetical protein
MIGDQWIRKATLIVANDGTGLDLSEMRFKFRVSQSDNESPNTAVIRVYNLAPDTVRKITGRTPVEFTRVVLQAGYENAAYGVIFDGTIKQFRRGKENATDTYLDILAAVGDVEYNFGLCNATVAAGSTIAQRTELVAKQAGLTLGNAGGAATGGTLPRGKVLWGMARAQMRCEAMNAGATWSIQDGKVDIVPLAGYLPGEAVVLSAATGLVGIPEQTEQGVTARCLLNPKLRIGGLVQIDNASINQTSQADLRASGFETAALTVGQLPFDKYAGVQLLADVTTDGFYRLYQVEYIGDTRGQEWYSELVGLAVDKSSDKVLAQ